MATLDCTAALERLDRHLAASGKRADLLVVGGAVMCLVYETRDTTKDVDAWFSDPAAVRAAARAVAEEMGLPSDWLNDAAKGYLPPNAGYETWRELGHVTVAVADAETMLAMKCAASRTEVDVEDIRFLARHLGLGSAQQVLAVVARFYPEERLPVRTRLLLEEMFGGRA